jgi:hypothetical protein
MDNLASARRVARSYGIRDKAEIDTFARVLMADVKRSEELEQMAREGRPA